MIGRATSVLRNEFVELDVHYADKVVVIRRTEQRFARVADVDTAIDALARALPAARRSGYAALIDMRVAPLRTDPSLEPAFARYRAETERGFERVVVVVSTVVGRARSDRLGQAAQIPLSIVGSLDEAWTLLRGG
jgi:hypothetical protein